MEIEDVFTQILRNIEDLDFRICKVYLEGPSCCVNCVDDWFAYNPKRMSLFDAAHDMIHAMYHDLTRCSNGDDTRNPCESRANREAILWLWDLFIDSGGTTDYFSKFIEATGCPFNQSLELIKKYRAA